MNNNDFNNNRRQSNFNNRPQDSFGRPGQRIEYTNSTSEGRNIGRSNIPYNMSPMPESKRRIMGNNINNNFLHNTNKSHISESNTNINRGNINPGRLDNVQSNFNNRPSMGNNVRINTNTNTNKVNDNLQLNLNVKEIGNFILKSIAQGVIYFTVFVILFNIFK